MSQIDFLLELDELGLSIRNCGKGSLIMRGKIMVGSQPHNLKDLTYQNRIDIIRECKREMRCKLKSN
jgi:hypothetical protein